MRDGDDGDARQFRARIESAISTVRAWEDVELFRRIRASLPWEDLRGDDHNNKTKNGADDNKNEDGRRCPYSEPQDVVLGSTNLRSLQRLARHFRATMTWVNQPPCENPECNNNGGERESESSNSRGGGNDHDADRNKIPSKMEHVRWRGPETDEERAGGAARVEVYRCLRCHSTTCFPRYNRPATIFETRRGRCGEYANLFGAYCRAVGLEARYVLDWTDHVWTECLVDGSSGTWVMVDSCEGVINEPSMYEAGWGKKLSYVLAVSPAEVVDVTPRYTREFYSDDFQGRRRAVIGTELAGEDCVRRARQQLLQALKPKQREEIAKRLAAEEAYLSVCRNSTDWEGDTYDRGRISGSYAWKVSRREVGRSDASATTEAQGGKGASKDDGNGRTRSCAHQLAVENYCPTVLNESFSIRVVPHPTESRHDAIRVGQTGCAVGSFDAGKSHGLSAVVVDEGEAMLGCVVQSRAFDALADLVEFVETVPTGRIVALHGSLQKEEGGVAPESSEYADKLTGQLPGIIVSHLFEGILFVGQVRLKTTWSLCQSFTDAPNGIEARSNEAATNLAERQIQQLRLKAYRETRPRTIVGRLQDIVMPLERQLAASHEEKRRSFLSWEGARSACAGYVTHPGGPVYLLGHRSFPLEHVPEEQWASFLWLPPPLVPADDDGIVETAGSSEPATESAAPAFNVPLDSFFATHLGREILSCDGNAVATETALSDARLVAFYFSAHWCGPCRSFTPMLAEMYHTLKEVHPTHGLEIVFISSDRDISSFRNYFASMPWLALPMSSHSFAGYKQRISSLYGVRGIPALVVLDAMSGQVVVNASESRAEVVNARNRGDDAIEAMFSSWMDRLPTETKELASMLALSVVEDKVASPLPPPPSSPTQDPVSEYLRRSTAVEPEKDVAAQVQEKFKQLVNDYDMSPNAAAAKAIRIVAEQSSHMPFELESARVTGTTRDSAESFQSHFQGMKRSEETNIALQTALKYLENVQKEPWNPKFRQFKLSNKIADRLFPVIEAATRTSTMEVVASGAEYNVSIPIFAPLDEVVKQLRLLVEEAAVSIG